MVFIGWKQIYEFEFIFDDFGDMSCQGKKFPTYPQLPPKLENMPDMDPDEIARYMPGERVGLGIGTDGKTIKRHVDILEQRDVPMTSACWGVYSHDLNNGKGKVFYYEIWFLEYDRGDCNGVKEYIDPMDPDNKYGAF